MGDSPCCTNEMLQELQSRLQNEIHAREHVFDISNPLILIKETIPLIKKTSIALSVRVNAMKALHTCFCFRIHSAVTAVTMRRSGKKGQAIGNLQAPTTIGIKTIGGPYNPNFEAEDDASLECEGLARILVMCGSSLR